MSDCGPGLLANRHMDVGEHYAGSGVIRQCAGAEGFDPGQMNLAPDGRLGILELLAGADDLGLGEPGDEHRDVALAEVVVVAERGQRWEEVFPVVEGHGQGAADGQFVAAHEGLTSGSTGK